MFLVCLVSNLKRIKIGTFPLNNVIPQILDFNLYKYYEFIASAQKGTFLLGSRGLITPETKETSSIGYNDLGNTVSICCKIENNILTVVKSSYVQNFEYTLIGYTY